MPWSGWVRLARDIDHGMAIKIDPHAPEPSYIQLAGALRSRIRSGEYGPRQAIPSITYLVGETGLAVGTVRRAVRLLVDEGLVYTVPGRGTFVRAG
jgi:DNA-binding GntR family transcriptional regulator